MAVAALQRLIGGTAVAVLAALGLVSCGQSPTESVEYQALSEQLATSRSEAAEAVDRVDRMDTAYQTLREQLTDRYEARFTELDRRDALAAQRSRRLDARDRRLDARERDMLLWERTQMSGSTTVSPAP